MAKKSKATFDPKEFLATVNGGRTLSHYRKGQAIFSQGDLARFLFFTYRAARSRSPSFPIRERKPLSQSWGLMNSAERVA